MYGMEIAEIKDSPGLNVDISALSSRSTRFRNLDEMGNDRRSGRRVFDFGDFHSIHFFPAPLRKPDQSPDSLPILCPL